LFFSHVRSFCLFSVNKGKRAKPARERGREKEKERERERRKYRASRDTSRIGRYIVNVIVANVALAPTGKSASFRLLFPFLSPSLGEARATETRRSRLRNVADNVSGAAIRARDPIRFIAAANRRRGMVAGRRGRTGRHSAGGTEKDRRPATINDKSV